MATAAAVIAIVDDDESFRESLRDLLRAHALTVQAFDSAEAFLAAGAERHVDCLLVDASLGGGVSGAELGRGLRALGSPVPIIFLTGDARGDVKARLLAAGGTDCLFKPFEEEDLLAALQRALPDA